MAVHHGSSSQTTSYPHGSAWHWKQTDCWYYTLPGTKKRVPLFDEAGERIRGANNRDAAEDALARVKLSGDLESPTQPAAADWVVARVCSEYIQHCDRSVAGGTMSRGHRDATVAYLNDLCRHCGTNKISKLKKHVVQSWIESHAGWRSPATHGSVIAVVLAAFNRAEEMFDVPNPLKGLKKPKAQPRLQSFSPEDEQAIYAATEERFREFLFAAIHTGLRPFCELAKITADDVEVTDRGMLWRVYSSKTKKTRKVPVRTEAAALVRRLMKAVPPGSGKHVFRNSQGNPWTKPAGKDRMFELKKRLGWHDEPRRAFSMYTYRHTFAHGCTASQGPMLTRSDQSQ
ncbi:MAG TPA: tyrosine-type recombinase/integrase [Pirellulales bacterium]|nr:tyrosine-type recombinase/integrase [Pirellulales bacterium]